MSFPDRDWERGWRQGREERSFLQAGNVHAASEP